jgi:glucose/arabinose dehydrogenase
MPTIARLLSTVGERMSGANERRLTEACELASKICLGIRALATSNRAKLLPKADGEILNILRYAILAVALGCGGTDATVWARGESGFTPAGSIRIEPIASGLRRPVYVTAPQGDSRLFVVEQAGVIRIVKGSTVLPRPFLDIRPLVHFDAEQGLLSMAFHPEFRSNGYFFVYFLDRNKHILIERYRVSANPDVADGASRQTLLSIDKPGWEHNGGLLRFGPDGMLFLGTGDGGLGRRLAHNAQDPKSFLGKMLRLDVNDERGYRIPAGNMFRAGGPGRPEIWATGVRNPWRFSFDSAAGLIYVADVGHFHREEVNVVRSNRQGANFGWRKMEGGGCFITFNSQRVAAVYWKLIRVFGRIPVCRTDGLVLPVVEYAHSVKACAVIGGHVYQGRSIPMLAGSYLFSDFCGHWLRTFRYMNGRATEKREWKVPNIGQVVSFGEDASGETYIIGDKGVFRLTGATK